jgi:hypothetical protein
VSGKLVGADKLQRRLRAVREARPLLQTIQLRAVAEAKKLVPRKTGHTARTIRPGSLTDRFAIVEAAGAAVFLEGGTRPHIIRPKNKSVLSWPANASGRRLSGRARTNSGRRIFARVVHHPGTKAQPFLVPGAVAAVKSVGIEPIIKAWNEAA